MINKSIAKLKLNKTFNGLIIIINVVAFISIAFFEYLKPLTTEADTFLVLFSLTAIFFTICERKNYPVFFLLSTFAMITSWRLAALANYAWVTYVYLLAMILIVCQFIQTVWLDVHTRYQKNQLHLSIFEWQLVFIRIYLGCDLIPHFCEKLFAGSIVRTIDVNYFTSIHSPSPFYFVLLAGLIEFSGALAISCGFMTRLAGIGLFVYFLVAAMMGHHFSNGFIWANPNGGWEYPLLCALLFLSFAIKGANLFSVDANLQQRYKLPNWLLALMGKHY